MPISFRKTYSNVQFIIDAFETSIQKPSNATDQALTWSNYKQANTIKNLIAITPDGFIAFVSEGYGGRISDEMLVTVCGFLNLLKPGMSVMADRGFKKVETYLVNAGCSLVRPPSVKAGVKLGKSEVLSARKIAANRIHVERAIRRIREFKILCPHSCMDNKLVHHIDDFIVIACGLVNLKTPLIK